MRDGEDRLKTREGIGLRELACALVELLRFAVVYMHAWWLAGHAERSTGAASRIVSPLRNGS